MMYRHYCWDLKDFKDSYYCSGSSSNSDSEVDSCSKTCVKAYVTLKEQYDSLDFLDRKSDVIDIAFAEYAQEVLRFSDSSTRDFILEEIEACLTDDSIPSRINDDNFDPEGDLLLLEKLLNDDPSSLLPPKELHVEELKIIKSSIDDPPELELKDLPSHLE
ncbi:hypothetical protein Tco_1456054 [Tanacetum coccineum]